MAIPLMDIMDIYEYKMGGMVHSEFKLKDALKASESHNRHTQLSMMQSKAEVCTINLFIFITCLYLVYSNWMWFNVQV